MAEAEPEYRLQTALSGHQGCVNQVSVADWAGGGELLVTAGDDSSVKLWCRKHDESEMKLHRTLIPKDKCRVFSAAIQSPSEKFPIGLIFMGNVGRIYAYQLDRKDPLYQIDAHDDRVRSLCVDNNGSLISGSSSEAKVWTNQTCVYTFSHELLRRVAILPENGIFVTAGIKFIKLWEGEVCTNTLCCHSSELFRDLAVISGAQFLSLSTDRNRLGTTIRRWNRWSCLSIHKWNYETISMYHSIAALGSDSWVTGNSDQTVEIWRKGELRQRIPLPATDVLKVAVKKNEDIVVACSDGSVRIFSANPDRQGNSQIQKLYEKELSTWQYLEIPTIYEKQYESFYSSCVDGRCDIIEALLKNGINVNAQPLMHNGERAHTGLHVAMANNQVEIVKTLLTRPELSLDEESVDKNSPLHMACITNSSAVIPLYCQDSRCNMDIINRENMDGNSALYEAVKRGNFECVKELSKVDKVDWETAGGKMSLPFIALENLNGSQDGTPQTGLEKENAEKLFEFLTFRCHKKDDVLNFLEMKINEEVYLSEQKDEENDVDNLVSFIEGDKDKTKQKRKKKKKKANAINRLLSEDVLKETGIMEKKLKHGETKFPESEKEKNPILQANAKDTAKVDTKSGYEGIEFPDSDKEKQSKQISDAENIQITESSIVFEGIEREIQKQKRSVERKKKREEAERGRRTAVTERIIPLAVSWRRDGEEIVFKFDSRGKVMKAGAIMRGEAGILDELTEEESVTLKEEGSPHEFCYLRYGQFGPIWAETLRAEEEARD